MPAEIKEILSLDWVKPEILEDVEEVIEGVKTGDRVMRVRMKFQDIKINNNDRLYPLAILKREVERLAPLCKEGRILGAAFHPEREHQIPDTALLWEDVEIKENGECFGTAKILPTVVGKDAQVIARAGGFLGVSSRGRGTMTEVEEEIDGKKQKFFRINDDYKMAVPGDLVITPSVPDAGLLKVLESRRNSAPGSIVEDVKGDNNVDKFTNAKEFKAAYPDMFKEIGEKAVEDFNEPTMDEKITAAVEAAKTKLAEELSPKIKELEDKDKAVRVGVAEAITALKKLVGEEDTSNTEEDEDEVTKKMETMESENQKLKDKVKAIEDADTKRTKDAELQVEMGVALKEELGKKEYANYIETIKKDLVVEGKVMADSKEDLGAKVKASFDRAVDTIAEAKKQNIISTDIKDIGKIKDTEKPAVEKVEMTEEEQKVLYDNVRATTGTKMSFEDFKKKIIPKVSKVQE